MSLRSSLRGPGPPPAERRRVSFHPEVVQVTLDHDVADSTAASSHLHDTSADLLADPADIPEQSLNVAEDMELTEPGGQALLDSDSDMELTEVTGGLVVVPEEDRRQSGSHLNYTNTTGVVLQQSMELTEPLDQPVPSNDPAVRLVRLQELRLRLLDRQQALLEEAREEQELEERTRELVRGCKAKYRQFTMARRLVPLFVQDFTPSQVTVEFQQLDVSVIFRMGEGQGPGQAMPITAVQWKGNADHRTLLEQRGVVKVLGRLKHSKQLRQGLQECMRLVYNADFPSAFPSLHV